jgi:prepilin-type N-terminal cleavage/methylation domain-containing protein
MHECSRLGHLGTAYAVGGVEIQGAHEEARIDALHMKFPGRIGRTNRRSQEGFTLPEVIMASTILSICAAGIMAAFASGFRIVAMTQENQRATQVLIEATEIVRLYSWDQIHTPGFVPTNFTEYYDPSTQSGVVYTGSIAIASAPLEMPASYRDNLRLLTVTLDWATGDVPRRRSLTTMIAKDGVQNYVY